MGQNRFAEKKNPGTLVSFRFAKRHRFSQQAFPLNVAWQPAEVVALHREGRSVQHPSLRWGGITFNKNSCR